jgi:hypothetical protein
VILSSRINIWREVASYWAGLVNEDTVEGTTASLKRWSELSPEEISAVRERSRKCFDELFNFNVTSRKVLDTVEELAQSRAGGLRHKSSASPGSNLT